MENGPVEIVDLPSSKMVDLSILFCMFPRPGNFSGVLTGHRRLPYYDGADGVSKAAEFTTWFGHSYGKWFINGESLGILIGIDILVGVWAYPSEKWWTSSVGMMKFPIWWESHKIHVPNHQPALGKEGLDPNLVSPLKDPRCCNAAAL